MTDKMKFTILDDSELNTPKYEHLRKEVEEQRQSANKKEDLNDDAADQRNNHS